MNFGDFQFHSQIIESLKRSISSERIPHALYFQGDEGSGNLPLAIAYAQEIVSGGEADMFGKVDDRVARLAHPDIHVVFPIVQGKEKTSGHKLDDFKELYIRNPFMLYTEWMDVIEANNKKPIISVSESEEIYKKLSLKSYEGGYKVLIVWQAELMNEGCSNKMLKLIEEPPTKTLIVLVGSDFNALLPTIKSRVQLIKIGRSTSKEVTDFLVKNGVPDNKIRDAVLNAEGSPGLALNLTSEVLEDDLLECFQSLMRIAFQKNVPGAIEWVDSISKKGKAFQMNLINFGVDIYRQANILNFMPVEQSENDEKMNFVKKFSPFIKPENIEKLMNTHQTVHYNLSRNGNPKLLLLDCTFKLMRLIGK